MVGSRFWGDDSYSKDSSILWCTMSPPVYASSGFISFNVEHMSLSKMPFGGGKDL